MRWYDEDRVVHTNRFHTAHKLQSVTIHYTLHPYYQKEVETKGIYRIGGAAYFCCRTADQTWLFVPAWMTDKEYCSRLLLVESPFCDIAALYALKQFLCGQLALHTAPNHITHENLEKGGGVYGQTSSTGAANRVVTAIPPQSPVGGVGAADSGKSY